jgi:hypothetical protein
MSRSPLHHLAHPMLALAGLTAVVSAPFGFMGDYSPPAPSALARTGPFVISWLLESLAFLFLAVAIAGLADHRGPAGRGPGAWAVGLGLVAAVAGFFERAFHAFLQPPLPRRLRRCSTTFRAASWPSGCSAACC